MTFAEVILIVGAAIGIYVVLRPFQRWLENTLRRRFSPHRPRLDRNIVDVTDFTSYSSQREDH